MSALAIAVFLLATGAGGVVFYLGTRRQLWRDVPLPGGLSRVAACLLVGGGVLMLGRTASPATALFMTLSVLMLILILLPCLTILGRRWRRS